MPGNGHVRCAPCGASLYPFCREEELGGVFLGHLAYLEVKAEGDKSMPGKRWAARSVQVVVPQDPCDMAKA
jgi:hypothetical protein